MAAEKHEFTTAVRDLLHLMVHSLYSNKEIFLRELISNASDALDKLRVESLTKPELAPKGDLHIRLEVDEKARTLTLHDNGIGMSREDVVRDIGTIARSGTKQYLAALKERAKSDDVEAQLIGQFGVGFYSTFMVADEVTLVTRKAGEPGATRWQSTGDGSYTIEETTRDEAGTTVTLKLKAADPDDGLADFTQSYVLQDLVRKHSDFVNYPIRMVVERREPARDEQGKVLENVLPKVVREDKTLNSMKAIWMRAKSEVSAAEYADFYRHVSHDFGEPLETIAAKMEGAFNARLLLFIPKKAPFDLNYRERTKGVHLYVKRVFIMDDCEALLPEWLRFVRGVIDSEDLSLNVSREILQQDRQVQAIRKFVVRKVLDALRAMKTERPDDFKVFWQEFGSVFKEGLARYDESREKLLELITCHTTWETGVTSLEDYVGRMQPDQKAIYYLSGATLDSVKSSPHLEGFKKKGVEVLFFVDPIDDFWLQSAPLFKEKAFVSVGQGEVELDAKSDDTAADDDWNGLLLALRKHLQDDIKDVRLSGRLTDSAACLVGERHDLTPQMEEMLKKMGQPVEKTKRTLELNKKHPFIEELRTVAKSDAPELAMYAKLLLGQAVLAEGGTLTDPSAYSKLVMDVAQRAIGRARAD